MELRNWPVGMKHTKQREEVYEVLLRAEYPVSAADIFAELSRKSVRPCRTNLSTVYRVLDAFEQHEVVERTAMPGEDTAYYKLAAGTHTHYATCLGCHKQFPLSGCPVAELKLTAGDDDFIITGHRIEIFGYCKDCNAKT